MTAAALAPDLRTLRLSRMSILDWLCERADEAIRGMGGGLEGLQGKAILTHVNRWVRVGRWLRVAIWLWWAVARGDWDAPRDLVARRRSNAEEISDEASLDREAAEIDKPEREPSERREFECFSHFLRRPFGEVVAMICKGIGLKPDWDAWSSEPWAQEELRTRHSTSPYAGYPNAPPRPLSSRTALRADPGPPRSPAPAAVRDRPLARPSGMTTGVVPPPPRPPPPNRHTRRREARAARRAGRPRTP
jgi:hypothetical protein